MTTTRKYGQPPFCIFVLHGGPGAAGEMAPVAKKLAILTRQGVVEPFQTKKTVRGQILELRRQITAYGQKPVVLIGWSWGAWLAYIFTAKYPALVNKLVLVSSGPFEAKYASSVMQTRLRRLSPKDRKKYLSLLESLSSNQSLANFKKFGQWTDQIDTFCPFSSKPGKIDLDPDIYAAIWPEAEMLRASGKLTKYGKKIVCPVMVIHGDYDPHPFIGVQKPLSRVAKKIRFILLKRCGHRPWIEKYAHRIFFQKLVKFIDG